MARVHLRLAEDCAKPCSETCNCGIRPDCAGPIEQEMQQHFSVQLDLCNQLEAIANALPQKIDSQKLLVIARSIFPTVKMAHYFEENRIFPHIQVEAASKNNLNLSLKRFVFDVN